MVSEKPKEEGIMRPMHDFDKNKKWVLPGIHLRPILLSLDKEHDDDQECSTTPRSEDSRIPARLVCPPPPKKGKSSHPACSRASSTPKTFFYPPDLDSIFIRRHVA